jgi:hypothetical protein
MKFKSFEISDHKIFKEKSKIEFSEDITKIIGKNGTGKTILFNAMKESFSNPNSPKIKLVINGSKTSELDPNLIFIDDDFFENIAESGEKFIFDQNYFLSILQKFSEWKGGYLYNIIKKWDIGKMNNSQFLKEIHNLSLPAGEKIIIYLILLLSYRNSMKLSNSPLVFEGGFLFGRIDSSTTKQTINIFKKIGMQVIVLITPQINIESDEIYEIIFDEKNRKSKIIKN